MGNFAKSMTESYFNCLDMAEEIDFGVLQIVFDDSYTSSLVTDSQITSELTDFLKKENENEQRLGN
jgi:hypothetical protein